MNYEEMIDLEVNKRLAAYIGLLVADEDMSAYSYCYREKYPSTIWVAKQEYGIQVDSWEQVNYCLTPADMWPIIELIWDELTYVSPGDDIIEWDLYINKYECGKLRAAAIVFLKIQAAKND